jgi:DNA-directed RNA polymerase specialized sigma24 family protein
MPDDRTPAQRGDETELFRSFSDELLRTVRSQVRTSDQNIEDACTFAWVQFLLHQPDRDRNWKAWLVRTAQREAWSLDRGSRKLLPELSDDASPRREPSPSHQDTWETWRVKVELEQAVGVLQQLPPRLREVAFLRATGFRYDQISEVTGDSKTTVGRLVRRAHERIHDAVAENQRIHRPSLGRAGRLEELERDLPAWLTNAIGRPPGRRAPNNGAVLLQWRRAALLIDDYRRIHGVRDDDKAIGERPAEPEAARSYTLVVTAIERVCEARQPCRDRSHDL